MPNSKRYTENHYLINNAGDIVVFLVLNVFHFNRLYLFSCCRNAQVTFVEKPQLKIICYQDKH